MKRVRKRICSLLLAFVMAFSLLPATAWAVDVNDYTPDGYDEPTGSQWMESQAIKIGSSDLYYKYWYYMDTSSGNPVMEAQLVIFPDPNKISGDFAIPDYTAATGSNAAPWNQSTATNYVKVFIASGVTEIGDYAFASMDTIKEMEIYAPASLKRVGEYAFSGCEKLSFTADEPLNLSDVTELGQNAFANCSSLGYVTLGEGLTAIPDNAFNYCGLRDIKIPSTVTSIGNSAFANNGFADAGELVLPDGLTSIGDSAFYRSLATGKDSGFTSITIPASVESIGSQAFYNHRRLTEVTVEGTSTGDGSSALTEVGSAAFGIDNYSAYATNGSFEDPINPEIVYTGEIGAMFNLPEEVAERNLFINGSTCYTGNITPLTYVQTVPATCTVAGYHEYEMEWTGVTPNVTLTYKYSIPALGHDWGEIKKTGASCERDGYFYQECSRCDAVTSTIQGSGGLYDPDDGHKLTEEELNAYVADKAIGHNYQPASIDNPILTAGQSTTLHYVCQNDEHDDTRDSLKQDYTFALTGKTLTATTTDTLNDLTSQLNGISSAGKIEWDVDASQLTVPFGQEGERYIDVKFTPTQAGIFNGNVFSEAGDGTHLQIKINVEKDVLNLSGFRFSHYTVSLDQVGSTTVTVSGLGAASQDGNIEYYNEDTASWSTDMPNSVGNYQIRIPVTFNDTLYRVPQASEDEYPNDGSTIEQDGGKYYLVHDFAVTIKSINAQISAKTGLVYNGSEQATVSVSALRDGCKVTFYLWENNGWVAKSNYTSTKDGDATEGIKLTDAGTYQVKVVVTLADFATQEQELTVTINKAPVTKPTPKQNLYYLPRETQQGFDVLDNEFYTISGGTGIDANTYTATATLKNPDNYRWIGEDTSVSEVEIQWQILARRITKPNPNNAVSYTYAYGQYHEPLTTTAGSDYAIDRDTITGVKSVYYIGNKDNPSYVKENAYTVTYSWMTNADEYTSVIHLNDNGNYLWSDGTNNDITVTWRISPAQLTLPAVTASPDSVVYDGEPYDDGYLTTADATLPGDVKQGDYEYSTNSYFTNATTTAPTDVGEYYVRRSYTISATNYYVTGGIPYDSFSITKATLNLTAPTEGLSVEYNGSEFTVPAPTVTGLASNDDSSDYTLSYTYTYTPQGGTDGSSQTVSGELKATAVGTYKVTVKVDDSCRNYQSNECEYTFTIQTGSQTINLSSDDSCWDGTQNSMTVTLGEAESFTVTGVGAVDPSAQISYAVTDGNCITIENPLSGVVKVKEAGEATVTVTAAATDKVGEASVEYKVTVNKGTAVIERSDISVQYDGEALDESDYAANLKAPVDSAHAPTGQLTYEFFTDEDCTQSFTGTPKDAGEYYLKISYAGDDNYIAGSKTVKVTISAAELDVTAQKVEKTYDGVAVSLGDLLTVKDAAGNTLTDGEYTVVFEDGDSVCDVADSGTYRFKVTAPNHTEYTGSLTVKIDPIALTLTPTVTTEKVYDGNTDAAVTAINGEPGSEITLNTAAGETISVTATAAYNDKTANNNKAITVEYAFSSDADLANYTFNGKEAVGDTVTGTLTGKISKKSISVTGGITATDKVYDGNGTIALTGTPTTEGFVGGDNVNFNAIDGKTGTVTNFNVGNGKPVTVTTATLNALLAGADAANYTITDDYTGATADITQRPVYLLFPGETTHDPDWKKSVPYSASGLDKSNYTVSANGFVGNDKLDEGDIAYTFNDSTDIPKDLGTYTVKAKLTDEAVEKFANYSIAPISGTIEIIKNNEDLKVSIGSESTLTYNGDGQDPIESITVTGGSETLNEGVGGYTITYSVGNTSYNLDRAGLTAAIKDAGSYTVNWKVTTTNYGDKTGSFTVTVERAVLNLSRDVVNTRAYNGTADAADQVKGAVLTGQKNDEDISVTVKSAVYDQATVDAGKITITYTITAAGGASLDNYKVSINGAPAQDAAAEMTEKVTATIEPADVTVTIGDQNSVYDGRNPAVKQGEWTLTGGTVYNSDDLDITLSIPDDAIDAGTYAITGVSGHENYNVTFEKGEFEITPRKVSVTIGDTEGIYGDEPVLSSVTLTCVNMAGSDSTELFRNLLNTTATETSDVGNYLITATNGVYGNYNVSFTGGTYTVEQRPITITIVNKESLYGCDIETLTKDVSYTGDSGKVGIVNNDNLGIQLSTTASNTSPIGTYPITGQATADAGTIGNYDITWSGSWLQEDSNKGIAGTYTIEKADLAIAFPNESVNVSMGGSVNNPLKFTNASASTDLIDQPGDVEVKYVSSAPSVATVDESTGAVTIVGPGDVTITATVTDGGRNFKNGSSDQYVIHVAGASTGIQVQTTPNTKLVYNGTMQQLLAGYTVNPANASVTFAVTANESGDRCEIDSNGMPVAQDAGSYRVSWTAKLTGYSDVSGWVDVVIDKANPSTGFSSSNVQTTYKEGKVFDSTQFTTLNYAADYDGTISYLSNHTLVAMVNNNDLTNISINSTGSAGISASFSETENYKAQTVSFTLEVIDSATAIQYSADDYVATYDGQPHSADITVTAPSAHTIRYSNNGGNSYDLTESPTITNVGELTIHYQISSPGYATVTGTQTVKVEPETITPDMVSGIAASYTYTGSQITVDNTLTVIDGSTLLVRGKDYEVAYGANIDIGEGSGSVTITGIGNYTGIVTEYFEISAVEASHLSASLNRHFGYYGDNSTNNATVTVKHGTHEVTDGMSVTVSGPDCTVNGQTITFNAVGVYTIEVQVTGTHTGSFTLYYTLLPKDSGGDFIIGGLTSSVVTYDGQDHAFTPTVSDTDGTPLADSDYKLTYSYIPFSGTEITGADYNPDSTEMIEAGLYTITVTGIGNYVGNASVTLLIAQRNLADGVDASIDAGLVFNGNAQEPAVTLTYNTETLGDFTTEYYNNVNAGQAQAVSTAVGSNNNFTGTRVDEFTIAPKSIETGFTAVADPVEYNFTGKVIVPAVTVTDNTNGTTLSLNTDFTVAASAAAPGNYKATVKGIGNYTGEVLVDYTILADPGQPVTGLELTVTPDKWTYGDSTAAAISVTHNGSAISDYTLTVEKDGTALVTDGDAAAAIAALVEPGVYTITANGTGAYAGSSDTTTVTISKIKPTISVGATPTSLSGGGTVKLTISGSNLPAGTDLKSLLSVSTVNGTTVDLTKLTWTEANGAYTAELTLSNANETYTFTLTYAGDAHYDSARDTTTVVTAQQTGGGGGGGGGTITPPIEGPDDGIADPDDTGVSDWLITGEHIQYLGGYGGGLFGPTDNMTRAQAAQMFYNLLKDKNVPITTQFTDVSADAWYAEPVGVLASLGIINGVGGGRYEPNRAITRAEFTAIAMRFAQVDTSGADIFPDVKADDWFYEVVVSAVTYGWVNGYADGTFRPNATITRAEVTAIVNRMLGRSADKVYVDAHADKLTQFTDVSPYYWAYYDIMEAANAHDHTKKGGTETWQD